MGVFLLASKSYNDFEKDEAINTFSEMGLEKFEYFELNDYHAYVWEKSLSNEPQYIEDEGHLLICAGTPIYKNTATITQSLKSILEDLKGDTLDYDSIRGSFAILYSIDGDAPILLTDQAGVHNVYFSEKSEIISSSFLGTVSGLKGELTLNTLAATEVITTGRLVGPDTLINEINRFELTIHKSLGAIKLLTKKEIEGQISNKRTFEQEVQAQIKYIDQYFEDIKAFGEHYGVDTGLTGGHDSRMMLGYMRKHFKNFQIHSFWRKEKDLELSIAEKVAQKANLPLKVIPTQHHFDRTEKGMTETLKESFLFYDGHIRMHCFLTEQYNTRQHREEILGSKKLGINGIGGEQYRNEWHIESSKWTMEYFIKYFLGYHLSGRCFKNNTFETEYFNYLKIKMCQKIEIDPSEKYISRENIQKYLNEIYVVSLMGARTNAENKLTHFITPYIDRQLTMKSYDSVRHHGVSYRFQQEMLRQLDGELASVPSGYGYDFISGEPIRKKIKYLIKEFIPKNLYQRKLDRAMSKKGNDDFKRLINDYDVLNRSVQAIRSLDLPIDEEMITCRPDLMPVYLSLGYFIYSLKSKLKSFD